MKEKTSSRQLVFLLAVLGVLLTIVIYLAPGSGNVSQEQISVEEVELVHMLLDKIRNESPELTRLIDNYRISFSENPGILSLDFFKAEPDAQKQMLLRSVVEKHLPSQDELAIVGE